MLDPWTWLRRFGVGRSWRKRGGEDAVGHPPLIGGDMPTEILVEVIKRLNVRDLGALACVCRRLNAMVMDDRVWAHRVRADALCDGIDAVTDDDLATVLKRTWRWVYEVHAVPARDCMGNLRRHRRRGFCLLSLADGGAVWPPVGRRITAMYAGEYDKDGLPSGAGVYAVRFSPTKTVWRVGTWKRGTLTGRCRIVRRWVDRATLEPKGKCYVGDAAKGARHGLRMPFDSYKGRWSCGSSSAGGLA